MTTPSKKYLVTGGSGFLGSAIVRRMVEKGYEIRILDNHFRNREDHLKNLGAKIDFLKGDIRDFEVVCKALKGMNGVIHLAFINGTEFFYNEPELVLDVGVSGMLNVLKACQKEDVRELVLASSSEVYQTADHFPTREEVALSIPDPLNPRYSYAGGKIISELLAVNFGRRFFERVLIFRPHNVYGPNMGWEHVMPQIFMRMRERCQQNPQANEIDLPIQGTGNETRSFIYIDDFVDAFMKVLEKGEHLNIYHIGTMEEVTISAMIQMLGDYFNKKITLEPQDLAAGSTKRRCPDIGKLKNLGFIPQIPLKKGLPRLAKWYDENADKKPKICGDN